MITQQQAAKKLHANLRQHMSEFYVYEKIDHAMEQLKEYLSTMELKICERLPSETHVKLADRYRKRLIKLLEKVQ